MNQLRSELEAPPYRIATLPIDARGYPVPWFVLWVDGVPEFRVADRAKWAEAVRSKLCWVCGMPLGRNMTFVSGPMCGVNRTSGEPPCHLDCAQWSARNCPFLSKPHMTRRENDLPEDTGAAGEPIMRNPGATLLWTTRSYSLFSDGQGGVLIHMGDPIAVEWFAEGKPATRAQVEASVVSGLPTLRAMAESEGPEAVAELDKMIAAFIPRYPTA